MDSQEIMYAQINRLCESIEELRKKIDDLSIKFNDFESSKRFKGKAWAWVGGVLLALLSTDAFLDLITNHLKF